MKITRVYFAFQRFFCIHFLRYFLLKSGRSNESVTEGILKFQREIPIGYAEHGWKKAVTTLSNLLLNHQIVRTRLLLCASNQKPFFSHLSREIFSSFLVRQHLHGRLRIYFIYHPALGVQTKYIIKTNAPLSQQLNQRREREKKATVTK